MLEEAFVSKSILYIYQNVDEIKEKLPPKYTQKILQFLPKATPLIVCFHPIMDWCMTIIKIMSCKSDIKNPRIYWIQ
jgi:hypothetical protein